MILVRLLGGARKSFLTDSISLEYDELALDELVGILQSRKPGGTQDLDTDNTLIAVNGVDSSAMDGLSTTVRSGDTVSIIPVIHGGGGSMFSIRGIHALVFPVSGGRDLDRGFLDGLRAGHPGTAIQAVSSRFVVSPSHARKILGVSLESKRRGILLSRKLETDLLLRFAATTQISSAIKDLGMRPNEGFVIIAVGTEARLRRLENDLSGLADPRPFPKSSAGHVKRHFGISQRQLGSVRSETQLEDLLQERASVLF